MLHSVIAMSMIIFYRFLHTYIDGDITHLHNTLFVIACFFKNVRNLHLLSREKEKNIVVNTVARLTRRITTLSFH